MTTTLTSWAAYARYGLLGLPLAFVALPLYVILPNHYAREFGVPLASLGGVLLAARLFDAVIDPLLGRWTDRLFAHSMRAVLVGRRGCRAPGPGICPAVFSAHPRATGLAGVGGCVAGTDLRSLQRLDCGAPVLGGHAGR